MTPDKETVQRVALAMYQAVFRRHPDHPEFGGLPDETAKSYELMAEAAMTELRRLGWTVGNDAEEHVA